MIIRTNTLYSVEGSSVSPEKPGPAVMSQCSLLTHHGVYTSTSLRKLNHWSTTAHNYQQQLQTNLINFSLAET